MTAHWIARVEQTDGLKLRIVLITFHCLTSRHDRKSLAKIILHLLDRAGVTSKVHSVTALSFTIISNCFFFEVSHFTMDNVSNNKTMMEELGVSLTGRESTCNPSNDYIMCFAHIIDLSSGQVIHKVEGKQNDKDDFDFNNDNDDTNLSNPIGAAHAIVRSIWASGTRRKAFNSIIKSGNEEGWFKDTQSSEETKVKHVQLLRDVQTRWDSVYHMLKRLHDMQPVRLNFSLN